jgi:O-antigen/teichoic acid export membrane protein
MTATVRLFERFFPAGSFSRNVIVMLSGTAFGPALNVLVMPVLTRLYTPEDFGVLAVFNAALTVLVSLPALRYEGAIPLPEDREDARNLQLLSLLLALLTSSLVALAVGLFGARIAALLNASQLAPYLWLLPPALLAASVFKIVTYWDTRNKRFGDIARGTIARPVGMGTTSIALGLARLGAVGLVVGSMIGQVSAAVMLTVLVLKRDGLALFRGGSLRRVRELLRTYRQFPLFQLPAALLNASSQQVALLIMAALYDLATVGQYGVARRIFSVPMFIIVQAVSQVFLQRTAEEYNSGGNLRRLVVRLYARLFLVGIGPTVLIFMLAPWACRVFLGAEYETAGVYTRLLIPWLFLAFISSPTSCVFAVLNRQGIMLGYVVALLSARILAIWAGWRLLDEAYWSIAFYALVGLLGNIYIMLRTWQISDPRRPGPPRPDAQPPELPPAPDTPQDGALIDSPQ